MSSSSPTPGAVRIGDRERDQATECLREHMAAGRLDPIEFDQRIETALTARYAEELKPLFIDLPAPRPDLPTVRSEPAPERPVATPVQPKPRPARSAGWNFATVVMWVAAITVCMTVSWNFWWLMLIPLFMGGGCGAGRNHELHRQRRMAARQLRWDGRQARFDARMRRLDHRHW